MALPFQAVSHQSLSLPSLSKQVRGKEQSTAVKGRDAQPPASRALGSFRGAARAEPGARKALLGRVTQYDERGVESERRLGL